MTDNPAGARWFKSSHSGPDRECVEVAHLPGGVVGVRDSKNRAGSVLEFGPEVWDAFLNTAQRETSVHP
ncbi:DUF397 domain-containing protein [Nocardia flavorosea]|uniref:DUF397 domain-containing protein n=1 Tax=Nocardia flavorosea TaxID=53429 RepID=UPI0024569DB5|nr:DUF397 domain-containing protein [Nocardia flavorosea]